MADCKITYGRFGCTVMPLKPKAEWVIRAWISKHLIIKNYSRLDRQGKPQIVKTFGVIRADSSRLLIKADGLDLEEHLKAEGIDVITSEKTKDIPLRKLSYNMDTPKIPYPYQGKIISDVLNNITNGISYQNLLSLQTGKGKTFISINIGAEMDGILVPIMLPSHMDQWVKDITTETDVLEEEIYIAAGVAKLDKILNGKIDLDKYKVVMISTPTLSSFYRRYENNLIAKKVPYSPDELFTKLAPGLVLIDEVDEQPHIHYQTLAYDIPVTSVLAMSASFFNVRDRILNRIYFKMFPEDFRHAMTLDKYVQYSTMLYNFSGINRRSIVTSIRGSTDYNHIAYEQWIARNPLVLKQYLNLLTLFIIEDYLLNRDNDKQSLLIFTAGIEMAELIRDRIFKDDFFKGFSSTMYTGEEGTLAEMVDCELTVTTAAKSQAGLDKPGLITVIDTTSTSATRATVQKPGRLRKIENKNFYIHLVNKDIAKQVGYSKEAYSLLLPRVKTLKAFDVTIPLSSDLEELKERYLQSLKD